MKLQSLCKQEEIMGPTRTDQRIQAGNIGFTYLLIRLGLVLIRLTLQTKPAATDRNSLALCLNLTPRGSVCFYPFTTVSQAYSPCCEFVFDL